jgi:hypothetical protein
LKNESCRNVSQMLRNLSTRHPASLLRFLMLTQDHEYAQQRSFKHDFIGLKPDQTGIHCL